MGVYHKALCIVVLLSFVNSSLSQRNNRNLNFEDGLDFLMNSFKRVRNATTERFDNFMSNIPQSAGDFVGMVTSLMTSASTESSDLSRLMSLIQPQNGQSNKALQVLLGLLTGDGPSLNDLRTLIGEIQSAKSPDEALKKIQDFAVELLKSQGVTSPLEMIGFVEEITEIDLTMIKTFLRLKVIVEDELKQMKEVVSDECLNATRYFGSSLTKGKQWAIKMIDSAGKPNSGLLTGKLSWPGSFGECVQITHDSIWSEAGNDTNVTPFNGQYCMTKTGPLSGLGGIPGIEVALRIGMCFPDVCNQNDTTALVYTAHRIIEAVVTQGKNETSGVKTTVTCQPPLQRPLDVKAKATLWVVGFFVLLITVGTLFDVIYTRVTRSKDDDSAECVSTDTKSRCSNDYVEAGEIELARKSKYNLTTLGGNQIHLRDTVIVTPDYPQLTTLSEKVDEEDNEISESDIAAIEFKEPEVDAAETAVDAANAKAGEANGDAVPVGNGNISYANSTAYLVNDEKVVAEKPTQKKKSEQGILVRLLLSFSAYSSGKKILGTKQPPGSLECINGIRFISMSWVILGHAISLVPYMEGDLGNMLEVVGYLKKWTFLAIFNATVSVDTFFLLSGLLVTYLALKAMKKKNGFGPLDWALFYFHRYWRLTPPYMLILMIWAFVVPYMSTGPFWKSSGDTFCTYNWWSNLLYVNNIFHPSAPCMGWSWYLSNDMQFYVISPLILFPLFKLPAFGLVLSGGLAIGSVILRGVLSHNDMIGPANTAAVEGGQPTMAWWESLYVKPWTRVGPYLVGMIVGYVLYKTKCKVKIHQVLVLLGWSLAFAGCCAIVYGIYEPLQGHLWNNELSAFYNAVWRVGWAMGVGWVIFACCTGHGGWINELLSWRGFVPLSRLTYCAYLVHPILMDIYFRSQETLIMMSMLNMVMYFFGFMVASYMSAFVLSLLFEAPMLGLEKVLLGKLK